jgi:predicted amidophosphoribosyltransferase
VLHRLAALLAPPLCGVCGDPCGSRHVVCGRCGAAIAAAPAVPLLVPGVDRGWAAARYDGVPRRLVGTLKFGGRLPLAGVAAGAMAAAAPEDEPLGRLVPVPADPLRHRWRGFDTAEAIAIALSRELGLPASACLERRHGPRQVGRSRHQRLAGPRVFPAARSPKLALLVDDVVTTGATLTACAAALRAAGAERVLAVAFARA